MHIQWYPGHMHKAGKDIKAILPEVDVFIEVLDARIPFSSQNPLVASWRGDKPCIKLLNKYDLADPDWVAEWQLYLERDQGVKTLAMVAGQQDKARLVSELCHKLVPARQTSGRLLHALIIGIPNVGKSTLINSLAGRHIAKTGNEPAITKNRQRIDIGNGIILFDTPGLLWPNLENENTGYRLAATGAIKDTAISHDDIATFVADFLLAHYPQVLNGRYSFGQQPESGVETLALIGQQRGCLRSGGVVDYDKVAKILLTEFRSGSLGRIVLENPAMMEQELAELLIFREQKAAKKLARKQRWKGQGSST